MWAFLPHGHVAGVPVEEALLALAPAFGIGFAVLLAGVRERARRLTAAWARLRGAPPVPGRRRASGPAGPRA